LYITLPALFASDDSGGGGGSGSDRSMSTDREIHVGRRGRDARTNQLRNTVRNRGYKHRERERGRGKEEKRGGGEREREREERGESEIKIKNDRRTARNRDASFLSLIRARLSL